MKDERLKLLCGNMFFDTWAERRDWLPEYWGKLVLDKEVC